MHSLCKYNYVIVLLHIFIVLDVTGRGITTKKYYVWLKFSCSANQKSEREIMCNCLCHYYKLWTLNLCSEDLCGDCAYKNVTTKCLEFVIWNVQEEHATPRSVTRCALHSKWRARLVNKVAKVLTSSHAGIGRSPAKCSPDRALGRSDRAKDGHRDVVPGAVRSHREWKRVRRVANAMEYGVCLQQYSAYVLSTTVHSGSFSERIRARARALHNNCIAELL